MSRYFPNKRKRAFCLLSHDFGHWVLYSDLTDTQCYLEAVPAKLNRTLSSGSASFQSDCANKTNRFNCYVKAKLSTIQKCQSSTCYYCLSGRRGRSIRVLCRLRRPWVHRHCPHFSNCRYVRNALICFSC